MSAWMVYFSVGSSERIQLLGLQLPSVLVWMLGIVAIAMLAYGLTRALRPEAGTGAPRRREDAKREDWAPRRSSLPPRTPTQRPNAESLKP